MNTGTDIIGHLRQCAHEALQHRDSHIRAMSSVMDDAANEIARLRRLIVETKAVESIKAASDPRVGMPAESFADRMNRLDAGLAALESAVRLHGEMSDPSAECEGREVFVTLGEAERHCEHHHCPGRCVSPATARRLAAELLTAADRAERTIHENPNLDVQVEFCSMWPVNGGPWLLEVKP